MLVVMQTPKRFHLITTVLAQL